MGGCSQNANDILAKEVQRLPSELSLLIGGLAFEKKDGTPDFTGLRTGISCYVCFFPDGNGSNKTVD